MTNLLEDKLNLEILRRICAGEGLTINLRQLSRHLRRHRSTIKGRVENLLNYKIVDRPIFPFIFLFKEYPLLIAVYAELPDSEETHRWLKEDKHIFAAFKIREGNYNIMLFEFHKSVEDYMVWRNELVEKGEIPGRDVRIPSSQYYFSNTLIKKYEPNAPLQLIRKEFKEKGRFEVYGYALDDLSISILECLINGIGIKLNENFLSAELNLSRATIRRRIQKMLDEGIILPPTCRFPSFFVPPGFILVVSMIEVKRKGRLEEEIINDPHITLAYQISHGRYNLLLFEAHRTFEDYLAWEAEYERKYPGYLGSIKNEYLSPKMTIAIDQQKVSLKVIEDRLKQLKEGRK